MKKNKDISKLTSEFNMVHFLRKCFVDRVTLRKACSFNDETEAKCKKADNNRTNYEHNKPSAPCPFFLKSFHFFFSVTAKQDSEMLLLVWSRDLVFIVIITSTLRRTMKGQMMVLMTMVIM